MGRELLAGDLIARAVAAGTFGPLDDRARAAGLDAQNVAEFLAYDIPFRTEPSFGLIFPPTASGRERDDD